MTRTTNFISATNYSPAPPSAAAVESDFVIILAALLCTIISVVGLISVRGGRTSANRGLKNKAMRSLPKFTYDSAVGRVSGECAICLAEYGDDEIRVLPQCGHCFHVRCVDTWLASHSSCPSCRKCAAQSDIKTTQHSVIANSTL